MKYKFFKIVTGNAIDSETELNAFCAQHRITDIEKNFVTDGSNSFWSICVAYSDNEGALLAIGSILITT